MIEVENFDDFKVYVMDNKYSFFHIDICNSNTFYTKMFEYFFDENRLLRYCENISNLSFTPSRNHYLILYRHLKTYIDDYNMSPPLYAYEEKTLDMISQEFGLQEVDGIITARLDKIGKIGEYIFSCLLSEYFNFDCIIPKIHLKTDYNMNVYGIDTLYYSSSNNLILFGESKFSQSINNGVKLINESLKNYEEQITTEFELVLNNRLYKEKLNKFSDKYGEIAENSLNIKDFIEIAQINSIGIPLFIAHGNETEIEKIFKTLDKINCKNFLGLNTIYYLISLPIISKTEIIDSFTNFIRERINKYEYEATQYPTITR